MSYNPINWTEELDENGNPETPVSAENLGKMDTGINSNEGRISTNEDDISSNEGRISTNEDDIRSIRNEIDIFDSDGLFIREESTEERIIIAPGEYETFRIIYPSGIAGARTGKEAAWVAGFAITGGEYIPVLPNIPVVYPADGEGIAEVYYNPSQNNSDGLYFEMKNLADFEIDSFMRVSFLYYN